MIGQRPTEVCGWCRDIAPGEMKWTMLAPLASRARISEVQRGKQEDTEIFLLPLDCLTNILSHSIASSTPSPIVCAIQGMARHYLNYECLPKSLPLALAGPIAAATTARTIPYRRAAKASLYREEDPQSLPPRGRYGLRKFRHSVLARGALVKLRSSEPSRRQTPKQIANERIFRDGNKIKYLST